MVYLLSLSFQTGLLYCKTWYLNSSNQHGIYLQTANKKQTGACINSQSNQRYLWCLQSSIGLSSLTGWMDV